MENKIPATKQELIDMSHGAHREVSEDIIKAEPIGWFERYLNVWIAIGAVTLVAIVWHLA